MAIKGGDMVIVGNTVVLDRVQTGGPGNVNIPTEKIYEVGNYQSVATVLDTPDLQFTAESFDVSAEAEALCLGRNFATDSAGQEYDLSACLPMDALGQFKKGKTNAAPFELLGSVVVPYLTVDSISYRYGLRDNAQQSFTMRGDSIYYNPGSAYVQSATGSNTANQVVTLTNLAYPYADPNLGVTRYALGVTLKSGQRLRYGVDYTEAPTGAGVPKSVAITVIAAVPATDSIRVVYNSSVVASYPQNSHEAASATRPAAIKGKNIDVYINGQSTADIMSTVQAVNIDWRVQLDRDEEFGNPEVVASDYDVPSVTGSIEIKPSDYLDFYTKLRLLTGVTDLYSIGPYDRDPLSLDVVLKSPDDGSVIKTLYTSDAKFTVPAFQARANQKSTVTINWESDSGELLVYKGARP